MSRNSENEFAKRMSEAAREGKIKGVPAPSTKKFKDRYGDYYMPFGEHKDKNIKDIPYKYLKWVFDECNNLEQELLDAIEQELWSRHERD